MSKVQQYMPPMSTRLLLADDVQFRQLVRATRLTPSEPLRQLVRRAVAEELAKERPEHEVAGMT
jgi:hypothetical protein